jgi:hypothetical protein
MKMNSRMLEAQLVSYEEKLRGFKSYLKELKDRTAEHGTAKEEFEADLMETEHNIKYYESAIAEIKGQLGKGIKSEDIETLDTILPRTIKQGVGSFILSSVSFVAGALLASRLSSARGGKDRRDEKEER